MPSTGALPLLVVRHVAWEGPHRILEPFADRPVRTIDTLRSAEPLPDPESVAGAVLMGGPMSANDTERYPRLGEEIRWLAAASEAGLPLLGICLGSQLLARALGARVQPAAAKELGWAPVEIDAADDPLLGALAPATTVLHWHGEVFALPPGGEPLANSPMTAHQAFRWGGAAWGLLFHPEADRALVDRWLAEPTMAAEAREALGQDAEQRLRHGAERAGRELAPRSRVLFRVFADVCRGRAGT